MKTLILSIIVCLSLNASASRKQSCKNQELVRAGMMQRMLKNPQVSLSDLLASEYSAVTEDSEIEILSLEYAQSKKVLRRIVKESGTTNQNRAAVIEYFDNKMIDCLTSKSPLLRI